MAGLHWDSKGMARDLGVNLVQQSPPREPIQNQVEDREIVVLGITFLAFVYAIIVLQGKPGAKNHALLIAALGSLLAGLIATNVENLYQGNVGYVINLIEHLAYLGHTALLVTYLYRHQKRRA